MEAPISFLPRDLIEHDRLKRKVDRFKFLRWLNPETQTVFVRHRHFTGIAAGSSADRRKVDTRSALV